MTRILGLALAVGCATEHDPDRWASAPPSVEWGDDTKASTVSTRFVVSFPDLGASDARTMLFRTVADTEVTVSQRAAVLGWAAEYEARFDLHPGLNRISLDDLEWLTNPDLTTSAFVIEADAPLEMLALWGRSDVHTDPAVARVLPIQELGTRYRVTVPPSDEALVSFSYDVVAVENGTLVQADPVLEPITLDAGQLVRIRMVPDDDASETSWLVTADAPVAVFLGEGDCSSIPCTAWEQLAPSSRWGTSYVAIPFEAPASSEVVLIAEETTLVAFDCGEPLTVFPGQVIRVPIPQPTRVVASRPVQALLASRAPAALLALTPVALRRIEAIVEPVDLRHPTFAGIESASPLSTAPPTTSLWTVEVADSTIETFAVDAAVTFSGSPFRGIEYGLATDVTFGTHLGYDCTDCVTALAEPVACP